MALKKSLTLFIISLTCNKYDNSKQQIIYFEQQYIENLIEFQILIEFLVLFNKILIFIKYFMIGFHELGDVEIDYDQLELYYYYNDYLDYFNDMHPNLETNHVQYDQSDQVQIYQSEEDIGFDIVYDNWDALFNFHFPFHFPFINNFYEYYQPLTQKQWTRIREEANIRNDSQCSICLESLKSGKLRLLCCSHVFHKLCIQNCQQQTRLNRCPLCRKDNYQQIEYSFRVKKQKKKMTKQDRKISNSLSKAQTQMIRQKIIKQEEIITKAISSYLYEIKLRYFAIEQNHQSNGKLNQCCCY